MIRDIAVARLDHDPNFNWRGDNVSRIENLSDIVFAIALGMLVSASSPPTTYDSLLSHLVSIVPVCFCFANLVAIWHAHFTFFRRYNLADNRIVFLNGALLLLVLFIAYPLRFIFDALFGYILGSFGDWSRLAEAGLGFEQTANIMGMFAAGYAVIFLIVGAMYQHALSKASALELDAKEFALTKRSVWRMRIEVGVAALVAALAILSPLGAFAGFVLLLNWPLSRLMKHLIRVPKAT